ALFRIRVQSLPASAAGLRVMTFAPIDPPPEAPIEPATADLAYMREQLFSPQWRPLMAALVLELFSNFESEEACGFLRQIGARMGTEIRLRKHRNLEELEAGVNEALGALTWGYARLTLVGGQIEIMHRAYPDLGQAHAARTAWRTGFSAILEGLYTTWLQ